MSENINNSSNVDLSKLYNEIMGKKEFEPIYFIAEEPVQMIIESFREYPEKEAIMLKLHILNGEHADKKYFLYCHLYSNFEDDNGIKTKNLSLNIKMLINSLLFEEGKKNVLAIETNGKDEETIRTEIFKASINAIYENIDSKLIGKGIECVFKPKNGKWQNIKSIKALDIPAEKSDNGNDIEF